MTDEQNIQGDTEATPQQPAPAPEIQDTRAEGDTEVVDGRPETDVEEGTVVPEAPQVTEAVEEFLAERDNDDQVETD